MKRRPYVMLMVIGVVMAVVTVACSIAVDRPLRDTEGFLGSAWIRLPLLIAGAFLADLLPRMIYRGRRDFRSYRGHARDVVAEHWDVERWKVVVIGLAGFYVTYISYRNLKNFLPFVMSTDGEPKTYDRALQQMDRWLFFGNDPSTVLHTVLGTSFTAHALSFVYVLFLPMVPLSVAIWAVWSRRPSYGYWFITAQCICWLLGTVSYYALPTLGPVFEFSWLYTELPTTNVSKLQDTLIADRTDIRFDQLADGVQSVAGFASLHVAITVTLALVGHYTLRTKAYRVTLWVYAGLTVVATSYFGWHYLADDFGGLAIAIIAVYLAGIATGQTFDRPWLKPGFEAENEPEAEVTSL